VKNRLGKSTQEIRPMPHPEIGDPSPWIARFAPLVPEGCAVLDVAAGGGRHTALFRRLGHPVVAVDRDIAGLAAAASDPHVEIVAHDLERDGWPFAGERFGAVVVTNYLWRPLLPAIVAAVAANGVLLYETFGIGHERFGRPSNPAFLLRPGELLEAVAGRLDVLAYECGETARPAIVQRLCALGADAPHTIS
jgi:SAM-dependent methyltransferase